MIYLASPYSHPDPAVVANRYEAAMNATALRIMAGDMVWSAIVHCHELAQRYSLPTDAAFWREYNFNMLRASGAMYVLTLEGWEESLGVKAEIEYADRIKLPIFFLSPEDELSEDLGA